MWPCAGQGYHRNLMEMYTDTYRIELQTYLQIYLQMYLQISAGISAHISADTSAYIYPQIYLHIYIYMYLSCIYLVGSSFAIFPCYLSGILVIH